MLTKDILVEIATAVNLREGSEGVRTFIRQVYLNQGISTKACSKNIRLPLPITAALKKEAIKANLLIDGATMKLTEQGIKFCEDVLGIKQQTELNCPRCNGLRYVIPQEFNEVMNRLNLYLSMRPQVDVSIDQAHGKPITALRRAALALEKGAFFNREIVLFGDDDLISAAIMLVYKLVYPDQKAPKITVFDIDERLLDYIDSIADELEIDIDTVFYDAKNRMPEEYINKFEVAFTDPPYTTEGAKLFLTRVKQLLKADVNLPLFFSYGQKSPQDNHAVIQVLTELGFAIEELIPNFNEYEGAAILGGVGQMMVLKSAITTNPKLQDFKGLIYTKEVKQK